MVVWDLGLLVVELVVYFTAMVALFGLRHRYGIGLFYSALGAMHFLETYLAATFYVAVPFGVIVSPGSTVLFAGKLVLLLLVYIREDAIAVRQPIYGLFAGNVLTVALMGLLRLNSVLPANGLPGPDFLFMDQMGLLMIWGTVLLLCDSILIILVYEHSGRWLGSRVTLRIAVSGMLVLAFDQLAFWPILHLAIGVPVSTLFSGLAAKATAAAICAVLAGIYLSHFERRMFDGLARQRLGDVFDALTYRQRYEDLLQRSGRDAVTGIADRGRMEAEAEELTGRAVSRLQPASVLLIDIDDFKGVNDRNGHLGGDAALRALTAMLTKNLRDFDRIYRFGGDEFVVFAAGLPPAAAARLAERLRGLAFALKVPELKEPITVSIGVANAPEDGRSFQALLSCADRRLYGAKGAGRNRVNIGDVAAGDGATGLLGPT